MPRALSLRLAWIAVAACLLDPASPAQARDTVTLQLKWKHQFQFAGYYAAQEQGYYREAGLEVNLVEAGPQTDPVTEVLEGRAQFGVSNSALLLAHAQGKPVVALAVIFQHSPLILVARPQAGIRTVHDLPGKRLMIEPHADEIFAYLRKEGLDEKSLTILPHSFNHQDLIDGRVDVLTAYSTDEPYFFREKRFPYLEFSPRAAGIDFYGDNLFTSADMVARKPDLVKSFRDASLKGWAYAMAHPEETVELILARYGKRMSREHLRFEAHEMQSLLRPDLVEIGHMNPGRWRHVADVYAEMGMLPRDYPLEGFLHAPGQPADRRLSAALAVSLAATALLAATVFVFFRLNRKLKESDVRFRTIADTMPVALLITRPEDGRIIYANRAASEMSALEPAELLDSDVRRFYPDPAQRERFLEEIARAGSVRNQTAGFVDGQGSPVLTQRSATLGMLDKRPALFVAIADLRERQHLEDALLARSAAIEAAAEGIAIADTNGIIEYANPALCRMAGYAVEELVGQHTRIFKGGTHDAAFYMNLWSTIRTGHVWRGEVINRRKDGSLYTESMAIAPVLSQDGAILRYVAIKHDITARIETEKALREANSTLHFQLEEIQQLQARLREQALRDPLTGLYNRRYLDETLMRELLRAKREGYSLSLIMLDVDHFKTVNDTYGHQAGDAVLQALGTLLQSHARGGDVPCRYGGEEFVVALPRMGLDAARERAEDWRRAFAATLVHHGDFSLEATLSAGVAAFPDHAAAADDLLRRADAALYAAKNAGRNRCCVATRENETRYTPC